MQKNLNSLGILIASVIIGLIFIGGTYFSSWAMAESVSEQLSPLVQIDEDVLRPHLAKIFQESALSRAMLTGLPWLMTWFFLAVHRLRDSKNS